MPGAVSWVAQKTGPLKTVACIATVGNGWAPSHRRRREWRHGAARGPAWHTTETSESNANAVGTGSGDSVAGRRGGPQRAFAFESVGAGGGRHKASVLGCLPLAAPIGLSPLLILTLCGSERVLVVSTEPPDELSCLTTPGVGCPGDGLLPVLLTRGIQMHTPSPCGVCRFVWGGGGGIPASAPRPGPDYSNCR